MQRPDSTLKVLNSIWIVCCNNLTIERRRMSRGSIRPELSQENDSLYECDAGGRKQKIGPP